MSQEDLGVPFVKGWKLYQTLGEGTFGEVKLAINETGKQSVAVKIIDMRNHSNNLRLIRKEVKIHQNLRHRNIIEYYGTRTEDEYQYIFIAYASGGELFDRIEPDVGMPLNVAHGYFRQLIGGVEYLHALGIAHRDLKPENIMFDGRGELKIIDFGLATQFRRDEFERQMSSFAGTPFYVAPEVCAKKLHRAEAADLFSCGIVLVAMLGGELPWDEADASDPDYQRWRRGKLLHQPWNKLTPLTLTFLRKILAHQPDERLKIDDIKLHKFWRSPDCRLCSYERRLKKDTFADEETLSQPDPVIPAAAELVYDAVDAKQPRLESFYSQPSKCTDMLMSSQLTASATSSSQSYSHLVKRMTRLWTKLELTNIVTEIRNACKVLGVMFDQIHTDEVAMATMDKGGRKLQLRALIYCRPHINAIFEKENDFSHGGVNPNSHYALIDFRLSRGDGLAFKRLFKRIYKLVKHIQVPCPPYKK